MKQTISASQGTALYVGAVLGSGILILPGMTASVAGTNALFSWLVMILLSIPLACTFAFLSIQYPSAGGIATFADQAFGKYAGALVGWFFFIAGTVGQLIVPLTGGLYIAAAFHLPRSTAFAVAAAILFIAVVANYFGLQMSGKVQLLVSGLTLLILLCVILFSFPFITVDNITPHLSMDSVVPIGQSAMLIFWSFFGWEAIASLAPEFKSPRKKNILRSTWGAIAVIGILYMGVVVAVIGTHAYSTADGTMHQAMNSAALTRVMENVMGIHAAWVTGAVAVTICLGTTNAFVASMGRLGYALSHQKAAPAWLGQIDPITAAPVRAVLFVGSIAGTGLLLSYLFEVRLHQLVLIPNSLAIVTYAAGSAAGIRLIKHRRGKTAAAVSCFLCLVAYPFVGAFLIIPIVTAVCCVGYVMWRGRRRKVAV